MSKRAGKRRRADTPHQEEQEEQEEEVDALAPQGQGQGQQAEVEGGAEVVAVDALPYADHYSEADKAGALALIQEELRTFSPRDYLAHLPPPPALLFGGSQILQAEMQRIAQGQKMEPMDVKRYALRVPEDSSLGEWQAAIDRAHIQMEHQNLRLLNLELLNQYGANAWLAYNKRLEQIKTRLEGEGGALRRDLEELNRARKDEQTAAGETLYSLQTRWYELASKNLEIDAACRGLEARLASLTPRETVSSQ